MSAPSALLEPLLAWYDEHARDLPWREPTASPWAVLVSEFMLQQTPVARVLPVYERGWSGGRRPADLAAAPAGDAVRAWGRLGYPRRALRLHAAATAIVERHGGEVPGGLRRPARAARRRRLHRRGRRVVRLRPPARRCSTPTSGGCWPGPSTGVEFPAAAVTRAERDLAAGAAARGRADRRRLGGRHDGARRHRLHRGRTRAARAARSPTCARGGAAGYPAYDGPPRTGQAYDGTDRQCRGRLLAVLRDSDGPVHRSRLDEAWPAAEQRDRCLALAGRRRPGRPGRRRRLRAALSACGPIATPRRRPRGRATACA